MRTTISFFVLSLCLVSLLYSQTQFYNETALPAPVRTIQKGLFQPLVYGYSPKVTLSTHALAFPVMPNLTVKWNYDQQANRSFSFQYAMYYPTPLLRLIARKGIGGIISPEFTIPPVVIIYNGVLITRYSLKQYLTFKAGLNLGLKTGKLDRRTTIDLPLVYPRLQMLYDNWGTRFGIDYRRLLSPSISGLIDADIFYYPTADCRLAVEHKALLIWQCSARNQITLGYKLVYGEYPFGKAWHLLLPLIDFQRIWQLKSK